VSAPWKKLSFAALAAAAMAGCSGTDFVSERPVDNPVPPLKAGVYRIEAVDVRPVATREVEPDYPPELGSILTGSALVVFTVRADGKVADASVVEADDVLFGEAAVAAVRKWRFHPALVKGAPVDCRMTLPFIFTSPYGRLPQDGSVSDAPNGSPPDGSHQTAIEPR
jgi:TonB family protein